MPRTKTTPPANGATEGPATAEILTLPEAAAYLRVPEGDVLRMVQEQGLPARKIGEQWRFLKPAVQDWLRGGADAAKEQFWATQFGALKDDPYLEEMLRDIYKRRGRP